MESRRLLAGSGFTANFYDTQITDPNQVDTTPPTYSTNLDTIDFSGNTDVAPPGAPSDWKTSDNTVGDDFTGKITFQVVVPATGFYTFFPKTDDGAALTIDGVRLDDRLGILRGPTEDPTPVKDSNGNDSQWGKGDVHQVSFYLQNGGGGWDFELRWSASAVAGDPADVVPKALVPAPTPTPVDDLAPMELQPVGGDFSLNAATLQYSYNGPVEFGLVPTNGAAFTPLLEETSGSVAYDNASIQANGTFTALVGNLSGPVFTGSFAIPVGTATTSQMGATSAFNIAGLSTAFSALTFAPGAGGATAASQVQLTGSFILPASLGGLTIPVAANDPFVISDGGFTLKSASVSVPDDDLTIGGLKVSAKDMAFQYTSASSDLKVQGDFSVEMKSGPTTFTLDLNLAGDNFIDYNPAASPNLSVVGTFSYSDPDALPVFSDWFSIVGAQISVNTITNSYSGSVTVEAGGKQFEGSLGILNGELDSIGLTASELNVPLGPDGLFLQSVGGTLDHLAPDDPAETTITGTLGLSYGPEKTFQLPAILGGTTFKGVLLEADVTTTVKLNANDHVDDISGEGNVTAAGGMVTGKADFDADLSARTLSINGSLQAAKDLLSFQGTLSASKGGDLSGTGTGTITIPVPLLGNVKLGSATLLGNLSPSSDPAQSYFDGWGTLSVFGRSVSIGAKINLAGTITLLNASNLPAVGAAAPNLAEDRSPGPMTPMASRPDAATPAVSVAVAVGSGEPYILLAASWDNPSATVPFQVIAPDGTVYTNADAGAGKISVVSSLSGSTNLVVAVDAPTMGTWSLTLPDPSGLGTVQFGGFAPTPSASVRVTEPVGELPAGDVFVSYDVADPNPGSAVSLFYDTQGAGFQGVPIAAGLPVGIGSFTWDTTGVSLGRYHVYAIVTDEAAIPTLAYAGGGPTPTTAPTVPVLNSTTINGGSAQRSTVKSVMVTFNQQVALTPNSLTLSNLTTDSTGAVTAIADVSAGVTWSSPDGGTTWVASVVADGPVDGGNGSLSDGVYRLTLHPAAVTAVAGGLPMAGGDQVLSTFHRLFGDADGNGTVNALDYARFKQAFGSATGAAGYNAAVDFDGNGTINALDYAQFRKRFGMTFVYS